MAVDVHCPFTPTKANLKNNLAKIADVPLVAFNICMFIRLVLVIIVAVACILACQRLIDKYSKDNETMRKFVHVLHGIIVASLVIFAPLSVVIFVEVFFLMSMFVARYLYEHFSRLPWVRYLGRVYNVGRVSYGDFFFPISVIIVAFIANTKWELAAAVLILGLADAVAALIGKRFGKNNSYKVFGQKKSFIGSVAFLVVTIAVVLAFAIFSPIASGSLNVLAVLGVCLAATAAENLGVYGSDNLLIPIVSVLLLNQL